MLNRPNAGFWQAPIFGGQKRQPTGGFLGGGMDDAGLKRLLELMRSVGYGGPSGALAGALGGRRGRSGGFLDELFGGFSGGGGGGTGFGTEDPIPAEGS
jgi:hypothetical protein